MAEDKALNFIPISRKLFEHKLWDEKREFSKFEAWLDLLQTARWEKEEKVAWINNRQITYGRGQIPCSLRFLQKRWNWSSVSKVERYLIVLKNEDMLDLETGQGQTVITICKYDDYNPLKKEFGTVKGHPPGQQKDKSNKERNKEDISSTKSIVGLPTSTPTSGTSSEDKKVPSGIASKSIKERAQLFVDKFNKIRAEKIGSQSKYQATDLVVKSFGARLKEHTPVEMLFALTNVFSDSWHQENNYQHVTPEYILRPSKMDKYINTVTAKKTTKQKMQY